MNFRDYIINGKAISDLLKERVLAKKNKNYVQADILRDQLYINYGIKVIDTKRGQFPANLETLLLDTYETDLEKVECSLDWAKGEIKRLQGLIEYERKVYKGREKFFFTEYLLKNFVPKWKVVK